MQGLATEDRAALLEYRILLRVGDGEGPEAYQWSESVPMVDARAFSSHGKGMPLNGHLARFAAWNPPPMGRNTDPVVISSRLRALLLALYDDYLTDNGGAVDYKGLRSDSRFRAYVDLAASLESIDLGLLATKEAKLAFWINTYNSLIVHALTVVGPAQNTLQRLTWFGRVAYSIGGHVFSADDIEHGILRGNASTPASPWNLIGLSSLAPPTFRASDPRRAFSLERRDVDPRIHFALNCGAKSCPAIKVYSAATLEDGLQGAAAAFCAEEIGWCDGTAATGDGEGTLAMSSILKWYGGDFGATQHQRLRYLMPYMREEVRAALQGMTDEALDGVKVSWKPYDWTTNDRAEDAG